MFPPLLVDFPHCRNAREDWQLGGFPPSLARYFIVAYSKPGDIVLDPFCGKGTALYEAMRLGRHVGGADIAPDAVVVSRAKCRPVSVAQMANYVQQLNAENAEQAGDVPQDVRVFYDPKTLRQMLSIREQLLGDMARRRTSDVATFACGALLGILHGHSRLALSLPCNQAFAMSPNYVRKYARTHGLKRPRVDVKDALLRRCLELLPAPRLDVISRVIEAPAKKSPILLADQLGQASLILTSPPYLNRQTYIKDSWLRTWFLGREKREVSRNTLETGNVANFVAGMKSALAAMASALLPGGRIVLVCGRAKITISGKNEAVRIGELCVFAAEDLAHDGVGVERVIIDRKLMKRGSYFAVHHGRSTDVAGVSSPRFGEEEIIVLRKR